MKCSILEESAKTPISKDHMNEIERNEKEPPIRLKGSLVFKSLIGFDSSMSPITKPTPDMDAFKFDTSTLIQPDERTFIQAVENLQLLTPSSSDSSGDFLTQLKEFLNEQSKHLSLEELAKNADELSNYCAKQQFIQSSGNFDPKAYFSGRSITPQDVQNMMAIKAVPNSHQVIPPLSLPTGKVTTSSLTKITKFSPKKSNKKSQSPPQSKTLSSVSSGYPSAPSININFVAQSNIDEERSAILSPNFKKQLTTNNATTDSPNSYHHGGSNATTTTTKQYIPMKSPNRTATASALPQTCTPTSNFTTATTSSKHYANASGSRKISSCSSQNNSTNFTLTTTGAATPNSSTTANSINNKPTPKSNFRSSFSPNSTQKSTATTTTTASHFKTRSQTGFSESTLNFTNQSTRTKLSPKAAAAATTTTSTTASSDKLKSQQSTTKQVVTLSLFSAPRTNSKKAKQAVELTSSPKTLNNEISQQSPQQANQPQLLSITSSTTSSNPSNNNSKLRNVQIDLFKEALPLEMQRQSSAATTTTITGKQNSISSFQTLISPESSPVQSQQNLCNETKESSKSTIVLAESPQTSLPPTNKEKQFKSFHKSSKSVSIHLENTKYQLVAAVAPATAVIATVTSPLAPQTLSSSTIKQSTVPIRQKYKTNSVSSLSQIITHDNLSSLQISKRISPRNSQNHTKSNSISSVQKEISPTPVLTMSIEDFQSFVRIKSESIMNYAENDKSLTHTTNNFSYRESKRKESMTQESQQHPDQQIMETLPCSYDHPDKPTKLNQVLIPQEIRIATNTTTRQSLGSPTPKKVAELSRRHSPQGCSVLATGGQSPTASAFTWNQMMMATTTAASSSSSSKYATGATGYQPQLNSKFRQIYNQMENLNLKFRSLSQLENTTS